MQYLLNTSIYNYSFDSMVFLYLNFIIYLLKISLLVESFIII